VGLVQGRRYDGNLGTPEYRVMVFDRYQLRIESSNKQAALPSRVRTKPVTELLRVADAPSLGELSYRINTPLTALFLVLLAIPLSFVNPRAGRSNNLLLALLIYLTYNNVVLICKSWVSSGKLSFASGLLLPHLVALILMILFFYRRIVVMPFWRRRAPAAPPPEIAEKSQDAPHEKLPQQEQAQ
jgi:lipopolysaccharide export system permease protein